MITLNNFNAQEKILQYQDKIDNYLHGHETLISFELDLTNNCNSKCPKCVGVKDLGGELSASQITSIIDQMSDLNVKSVVISGGGEPLMSPYFIEALHAFRNYGISVGLNSNGILLDEDKSYAILETCKYFRISLDAGTPNIYELTHGLPEEMFWHVIMNIKDLMQFKESIASSTTVGLGYLTGPSTECGIMDFFRLSNDLRVDFAQLRPFTGEVTNVDKYMKEATRKYPTLNIRSSTHKYEHVDELGRPYHTCHGMYFNTVITADFKMWACIHHRQNMDYFLGDLSKSSIRDILKSERMKQIQQLVPNSQCPMFCRNDAINRTLDGVCSQINHKEFL